MCAAHLVGSFQRFHQFPEANQSSFINSLHVNSEMFPVTWITQDVIKLENLDVGGREKKIKYKLHGTCCYPKYKPSTNIMLMLRSLNKNMSFNIKKRHQKNGAWFAKS